MKRIIFISALILITITMFSCSRRSSSPVIYSKNFSQGIEHENSVYFLMDYKVWKRGRSFWFIMPFEGRVRILFREIYLYRYQKESAELIKEAVIRDNVCRTFNIVYTRIVADNGNLVFSHHTNNMMDSVDLFIWDTKNMDFADTGYPRILPSGHELYKKYFEDYISPSWDNPGIITITELRNNILKNISNEQYQLRQDW